MIPQQQLANSGQVYVPVEFVPTQLPANVSLLGNKFSQAPTMQAVAHGFVDLHYFKLFSAYQSAFKLGLLKQQKFTPEGKQSRVAASLAALNAAQPTELSLQQWKEIVEEIEDDED
jgi:hypothetical protein